MEEEKMDTSQQGQKMSLESLSKEEIINKYKGLLGIAKKAKQAKDEIVEENRILKEQLQQHETQKEADKKALMTMKEMLEAYTENKLQLTTQVSELQKQRKENCENLEKLSIENESLKRQLQRLTEDNESLLTDVENMESQLQQVSGLGKKQKQHLVLLEQEINQLKEVEVKQQEFQIKNEELFKELQELKEKYKFIKDINTEQRQKFNSLRDRFIEVLKKLKKLKECKRILLETQHEYADSVSQWQNEIIKASKLLCKELNNLKEENIELLKKLCAEQPKVEGHNCVTLEKLNELLELSKKAKNDYQYLQKENLELKQNLAIKLTESTLKISIDKLDEQEQENQKHKNNGKTVADQDKVDSKTDFELCYKIALKLEVLQKLAAKANEDYQKQSKELNQLKLDYKVLQQKLQHHKDNQIKNNDFDENNERNSLQHPEEVSQQQKHYQEMESLQEKLNQVNKEKQHLHEKLQEISNSKLQEETRSSHQLKEEFLKVQKSLEDSLNESQIECKELLEKLKFLENSYENKSVISQQLKEEQFLKTQRSLKDDLEENSHIKRQSLVEKIQFLEQKKSEEKQIFELKLQELSKENQKINEKFQKMSDSNHQDSETSAVLKEQLLTVQQSLEEYQEMYKQKEIEHRELLDEMRELNEALKARGDLISRQQEEHQILKMELKSNSEKLAKIQQALDQKDKQLNEKQTELATMQNDIETTKQKIELLGNSSSLHEEKVRVLTTELETLKTNQPLNELDNQSDVLSTSTISRADELQRLREVDDSFEDKYNKLRGLAAKLKKKLQEEITNRQKLEKEIQELKQQENGLKTQLDDFKTKVFEMDSMQKQLNDKQKHLDSLKIENQKLKSSRKQANVLNLEIEAAEKSLTEVTNKLVNRTSELNAAQEAIKSKESTITQLRKEIELLESSKASEIKHSEELKQQIDHLQKTLKDEMHSKQQAYDKSKILEHDVENLKLELENIKLELAQTTSNQEIYLKNLRTDKEQLSAQLSATQEALAECEQKLLQTERATEDLRVEFLDYKVKAQAVLRKNQNRDSSKERELEEEILTMRATETQLNGTIQTLTTKLEGIEKKNNIITDDNNNLQRRSKELMNLIEEMRSQNDSLNQEIQHHIQQQHETLKQHRQQIESMDICHKEQMQSLNSTHQRQLEQLRKELATHIRLPPSVGATKPISTHADYHIDQSKLDFLLMEREDAEGSEEAAETLANLAASRKISNASSTKRSHRDFMPLDELLNTPMNAIHSETIITSQQQVPDDILNNTSDLLQLELNTTKERLQKQESRIRHLTALLAENEQDLARLTQMNDMLKEELRRQERSVEREQHMHNSEYIKNVIMKFLTLNNADEKTRLVPVLNTVLKLSRSETEILNCVAKGQKFSEPTQRQGGWGNFLPWGSSSNNNNSTN